VRSLVELEQSLPPDTPDTRVLLRTHL
jgi:hypothetical protein